jgi:RNA polymerase sigma factor (sigma-70 family)
VTGADAVELTDTIRVDTQQIDRRIGGQRTDSRVVDTRVADTHDRRLIDTVLAARAGDQAAWCRLVEEFGRLVYAVCRGFRLPSADAADVSQTVWLRLAENLDRIENPSRVGAWLATTTRRECLALLRARARFEPFDVCQLPIVDVSLGPEDDAIRRESISEVAAAFAQISSRCRDLLRRLVCDPDQSYQQISEALQMPIGSIGPTRLRCLTKLRRELEER